MAEAACAFTSFCLLSSATYLVNDVRDREQDRCHPRKRYRPVAAGELAPRGALRLATVIAALGLALAVAVRPMLGLVAIGYLTLTTSYSICWRRIVVADVVAVAGGFVVRAVARRGRHRDSALLLISNRHLGLCPDDRGRKAAR